MPDKRLEVLAPAGDRERLVMALTYGADAVYMAGTNFGMRAAAGNFDDEDLRSAVKMCHDKGVKAYITVNSVLHSEEIEKLPPYLEMLDGIGADSVIVSDLGVFSMCRKYAPHIPIHVSTQAGVCNFETANMLYDMGASRVILARELTLREIAKLRAKTPDALEIEAFAHGAMCVSFSGRCLLSNYLTGRDSNRGECAQPCRWKYHLVEEKRPGEYLEISEDGGTYIMNSRDLCMIDHLREMADAGITSVKIEGRMKSAYYAAAVTNAYRHAADAAYLGLAPDKVWSDEVNNVSHRRYSTGFYFDEGGPGQYYEDQHYITDCDVVAQVISCDAEGNAVVSQRNRFFADETIELLTPDRVPESFVPGTMYNADGEEITSAPHPTMEVRMKLPGYAPANSFLRRRR